MSKNKGIIIGTPKNPSKQKDAFVNVFETHKSIWKKHELTSFGKYYLVPDNISFIIYITRDQQILDNLLINLNSLKFSRQESGFLGLAYKKQRLNKSLKKKLASRPLIVKIYRKLK